MYKTVFTDVGKQKASFEMQTESKPLDEELFTCVKTNMGINSFKLNRGGVLICNGNPGCYVRYGSYETTEI